MSTTLTNGLKLPDKGSVDWYADMQNNYAILDGAVGTIAEHTSALAGKAPLSHTHTKSDVTDLLNSNFIPSANNAYDLGSSSNQWNNLYAKNYYYYNGTAWGLDKANVWSAIQTISYAGSNVAIALKHQETDIAASPTRNNWHYINFYDKNSVALGGFNYTKRTNGNSRVYLNLRTKNTNNDIVEKSVFFETNQEGTDWNLYPASNADINLGTSTNKWKTFNGINPGALSLPDNSVYYSFNTDNFVYTGAYNEVTVPKKGWLYLRLVECNQDAYIACSSSTGDVDYPVFSLGTIFNQNTSKYEVNFLMPLSVTTFRLYIYKTQGTLTQHKVFYTEGMIQ